VPVENKAFSRDTDYTIGDRLEVVGACPSCGSPIYGRREMGRRDEYTPPVRHSCSCRLPGARTT